jgi:hypothetical protein
MSAPYRSFADAADAARHIRDLSTETVVVDVEPLIAFWDTGQEVLDDGVAAILDQLTADPGPLRHVVFATKGLPTKRLGRRGESLSGRAFSLFRMKRSWQKLCGGVLTDR